MTTVTQINISIFNTTSGETFHLFNRCFQRMPIRGIAMMRLNPQNPWLFLRVPETNIPSLANRSVCETWSGCPDRLAMIFENTHNHPSEADQ
jgi:hypothetical protein